MHSTIQVELLTNDEDKTKPHGYLMKFDSPKECQVFATRRGLTMPPESTQLVPNPSRSKNNAISSESARTYLAEYDKLIIYCQGVKLKDRDIARAHDLLGKHENLTSRRTSSFLLQKKSKDFQKWFH